MAPRHVREVWFGAWAQTPHDAAFGLPLQVEICAHWTDLGRLAISSCPVNATIVAPDLLVTRRPLSGWLQRRRGTIYYHLEGAGICLYGRRWLSLVGQPPPFTVMHAALQVAARGAWVVATLRHDVRGGRD